MTDIKVLAAAIDGLAISQQLLVTWLVESHGANPEALAGLLADYRKSCTTDAGADTMLCRMQRYAERLAQLQNGGAGSALRLVTEGGKAPGEAL